MELGGAEVRGEDGQGPPPASPGRLLYPGTLFCKQHHLEQGWCSWRRWEGVAYRLSGFPRLLQHTDVPAAAATQRFPPPPSSGGALAMNSQGINRGRACRVMSTPSCQQCKLPRYIYVVWSWPGVLCPVQKCHTMRTSLVRRIWVLPLGGEGVRERVGASWGDWSCKLKVEAASWSWPCPEGAPDHRLERGKEDTEHEPCYRALSELCL